LSANPVSKRSSKHEHLPTSNYELSLPLLPLTHRPTELTVHHGNLVSHSADEPDNRRAPTSTAELPIEKDNDAALAQGARLNQEHELAARHKDIIVFKMLTEVVHKFGDSFDVPGHLMLAGFACVGL